MRLSRKGWNNVLIFSVLLIVFVTNFSHKLSLSPKVHQRTVISEDLTILEIKTPDFRIKRSGRTWQREPSLGLSEQQLSTLVNNWQSIELDTHLPVSNDVAPYLIEVYTTDKTQPIIVELYQYDDHYLLQVDPNTALLLNDQQLPLLLGR